MKSHLFANMIANCKFFDNYKNSISGANTASVKNVTFRLYYLKVTAAEALHK